MNEIFIEQLHKACHETTLAAAELLKKSQTSFDFGAAPNPHHKAYSRVSSSGKVSNIAAKGAAAPGKPVTVQAAKKDPGFRIPPPPEKAAEMSPAVKTQLLNRLFEGTPEKFIIPINGEKHLVGSKKAKGYQNRGVFIVAGNMDRTVFREIKAEAARHNLDGKPTIFAESATYTGPSIDFCRLDEYSGTAEILSGNGAKAHTSHADMVKELYGAFDLHDRKGRGGMGIDIKHPDYSTPESYLKTAKNILQFKGHERLGKKGAQEVEAMLKRHIEQLEGSK